jgi:hypothetical protein
MKCDNCQKEEIWLESIGSNFICHKCIQKNKPMGLIFRTNTDIFKRVLKKLKPLNYETYMQIDKQRIESTGIPFKEFDIKL